MRLHVELFVTLGFTLRSQKTLHETAIIFLYPSNIDAKVLEVVYESRRFQLPPQPLGDDSSNFFSSDFLGVLYTKCKDNYQLFDVLFQKSRNSRNSACPFYSMVPKHFFLLNPQDGTQFGTF